MSIPIQLTKQTFNTLKRQLQKKQEVLCIDGTSYVAALLVAKHLAERGIEVKATIVKPPEVA